MEAGTPSLCLAIDQTFAVSSFLSVILRIVQDAVSYNISKYSLLPCTAAKNISCMTYNTGRVMHIETFAIFPEIAKWK